MIGSSYPILFMKLGINLYRVAVFRPWDYGFIVELILSSHGFGYQDTFHSSAQDSYTKQTSNLSLHGPQLEDALHINKNKDNKEDETRKQQGKENEEQPARFHCTNYCRSYRRCSFYRSIEGNLPEMLMLYPDPYR